MKKSILRHQWYLTQELVILAFFDDGLPDEVKGQLARALLHANRPLQFLPGKPAFPTILQDEGELALPMFVGPNSWLAFSLLGSEHGWLNLAPDQWPMNEGFVQMAQVMSDLAVVNDTAERGVKDIEDYANSAHDAEQRGRVVLVSNSHRAKLPDFKKNEMEYNI